MHARGKNQRGFSLIELLTVMVVITILAGWAVMGTGGFSTASKANVTGSANIGGAVDVVAGPGTMRPEPDTRF